LRSASAKNENKINRMYQAAAGYKPRSSGPA